MHISPIVILDASEHPITSVTIFKSSKAEVARTFKLSLQKGRNKIDVINLPSSIDKESARIAGLHEVQLLDVVCTNTTSKTIISSSSDSTADTIRALEATKTSLNAEKTAVSAALNILDVYSKTLKSDDVSPEQANAFMDSYEKRARRLVKETVELDEKLAKIDLEIKTHRENADQQRQERSKKKGSTDGTVSAVVTAKSDVEAELKLTYIVPGATWTPSYELRATTDSAESSSVILQYRANVAQTTGEDWSNIALTLSTASMDSADQLLPSLKALRLRPPPRTAPFTPQSATVRSLPKFGQPQASGQFGSPFGAFHPPAQGGSFGSIGNSFAAFGGGPTGQSQQQQLPPIASDTRSAVNDDDDDEGAEHSRNSQAADNAGTLLPTPGTIIKESPLSTMYTVDEQSSIPSDGVIHKVIVAELRLEANVMHVAVPRVRAQAYLQARIKNTSDHRLLPGPVTILMNDGYVSSTAIQDIAPGDFFDCTLGSDQSTRISYTLDIKHTTAPFSAFTERYTTTTYVSTIKVHNRHTITINKILLQEALPISEEEEKVKVLLRKPESLLREEEPSTGGSGKEKEVESSEKCVARWQDEHDGKGGKKNGFFEWICEGVDAGEEVTLEAEWDVRAPVDVKWVEMQV